MFHSLNKVCFEGYTLIVPSVSVGNVGQLSVDLLISSLGCLKAGFLWHKAILPLVGTDPFKIASSSIALGAEVYYSDLHKLLLVQLRSSVSKTHQKEFLEELVKWTKSEGIFQVVVLTGSSNEERIDEQITTEPFRFVLCSRSAPRLSTIFSNLGWIALERRLQFPALSSNELREYTSDSSGSLVIPGGGLAKRLYEQCCSSGVPCVVLVKFCGEGDNIPDALSITNKLNSWLQFVSNQNECNKEWIFPPSWMFLFGNPPPKQLY